MGLVSQREYTLRIPDEHFDSIIDVNCREECSARGGTNDGTCASGFGVCCVSKYQSKNAPNLAQKSQFSSFHGMRWQHLQQQQLHRPILYHDSNESLYLHRMPLQHRYLSNTLRFHDQYFSHSGATNRIQSRYWITRKSCHW